MLDPQFSLEAPARKPFSIAVIQLAVFLIALAPLALIWILYANAAYMFEVWDYGDPGQTVTEYMLGHDYIELGLVGVGALLLIWLAVASTVGLHKGKRSARIRTAIWVGIMVLVSAGWATWMWLWLSSVVPDVDSAFNAQFSGADYFARPLTINLVVAAATFVLTLLAFILVLTPAVRRWTSR